MKRQLFPIILTLATLLVSAPAAFAQPSYYVPPSMSAPSFGASQYGGSSVYGGSSTFSSPTFGSTSPYASTSPYGSSTFSAPSTFSHEQNNAFGQNSGQFGSTGASQYYSQPRTYQVQQPSQSFGYQPYGGQYRYGQKQNQYHNVNQERMRLRSLLQEHTALAGVLTAARYDGNPQYTAIQRRADQNGQQIAALVGSVAGPQVQNEFLSLWREHLGLYIQYTDAVKARDEGAMDMTLAELDEFSKDMAMLVSEAAGIHPQQVYTLFKQHVTMSAAIIEAHAARDQRTENMLKRQGVQHSAMMADQLFNAVLKR